MAEYKKSMVIEPPDPPNNLGYANCWEKTPEVVINCIESKHAREVKTVGPCVTKYICRLCRYVYCIDSGD
jgi:hypothetical protein